MRACRYAPIPKVKRAACAHQDNALLFLPPVFCLSLSASLPFLFPRTEDKTQFSLNEPKEGRGMNGQRERARERESVFLVRSLVSSTQYGQLQVWKDSHTH